MKLIFLQLILFVSSPICPFLSNFHLVAYQSHIYKCEESSSLKIWLPPRSSTPVRQTTHQSQEVEITVPVERLSAAESFIEGLT